MKKNKKFSKGYGKPCPSCGDGILMKDIRKIYDRGVTYEEECWSCSECSYEQNITHKRSKFASDLEE